MVMLVEDTDEPTPILHTIREFISSLADWMTLRTACGRKIVTQTVVDSSKRRARKPTCPGCLADD